MKISPFLLSLLLLCSCNTQPSTLPQVDFLRLQLEKDSLQQLLDECEFEPAKFEMFLDVSALKDYTILGDTMKFFVNMGIYKSNSEEGPVLYFSSDPDLIQGSKDRQQLSDLDSVRMKNWQASIAIPQQQLGEKTMYFATKVPNFDQVTNYLYKRKFIVLPDSPIVKRFEEMIKVEID